MELIEIRDLDGPNLFAAHPVIKVEIAVSAREQENVTAAEIGAAHGGIHNSAREAPVDALRDLILTLHARVGMRSPEVGARALDTPGHVAVFFEWDWRESSLAIAQAAYDILLGTSGDDVVPAIRRLLDKDIERNDCPLWVRDSQRSIPAVGITGTNGKTTTTRLLSQILRENGRHVGWSSSSGVYIDGEQVMEGDYTGPSGARRVLGDPVVQIAVLETARGGILLRGLAYESNDVGVFLNVSADHLDMQGVETIETLSEVKGIVVRVTRPSGVAVLNADDRLVLRQREHVRAEPLLFSTRSDNPEVLAHCEQGGRAVMCDGSRIILRTGDVQTTVASLNDVPVTFGGLAPHMVENALAATGAAIGLGLTTEEIAQGLRTFRSDVRSNVGRLNVFRLGDRLIVVDYAHNESGLEALLRFARALMPQGGKLAAIVGTAGDRQDSVLAGLGAIAARDADLVLIKENPKYLRGRPLGEQTSIIRAAVEDAGNPSCLAGMYPSELDAFVDSLRLTGEGDAVAVMCVEDQLAIYRELRDRGAEEWE